MKIKRLTLHNYRGYEDETFTFVDGLNVIAGPSGSGKSAILKAMYFLMENDQSGIYHSNWIVNDKGKLKRGQTTWVELETFEGDIIRREKGNSENKYILNSVELFNFGTGVPQEVKEILNMGEVNIASQFESHFLLSDSPSKVAQKLNKMVDLDIIDKSIKDVNKLVKDIKKEKKSSESSVKEYEEKIQKFAFIDSMENDIKEIEKLIKSKEDLNAAYISLDDKLKDIQEIDKELEEINTTVKYKDDVNGILSLFDSLNSNSVKHKDLSSAKDSIVESENRLEEIENMLKYTDSAYAVGALLDRLEEKEKVYHSLNDRLESLVELDKQEESLVDDKYLEDCNKLLDAMTRRDKLLVQSKNLEDRFNSICDADEDIGRLQKQINYNFKSIKGSVCPMCGNTINDLEEVC